MAAAAPLLIDYYSKKGSRYPACTGMVISAIAQMGIQAGPPPPAKHSIQPSVPIAAAPCTIADGAKAKRAGRTTSLAHDEKPVSSLTVLEPNVPTSFFIAPISTGFLEDRTLASNFWIEDIIKTSLLLWVKLKSAKILESMLNYRKDFFENMTLSVSHVNQVHTPLQPRTLEEKKTETAHSYYNTCSKLNSYSKQTIWNLGKMIQGGLFWGLYQGIVTYVRDGKSSLNVYYNALTRPEVFQSAEAVHVRARALLGSLQVIIQSLEDRGETIANSINVTQILDSDCPQHEYVSLIHQIFSARTCPTQYCSSAVAYLFPDGKLDVSLLKKAWVISSVALPLVEEVAFRWLIQDVCLKKIPKKVLLKVAPQYSSLLESKTYSALRILITSALFANYHKGSSGAMPSKYVQQQVSAAFAMGIAFGAFYEAMGLSFAVGAHLINNLTYSLPVLSSDCSN